MYLPQYQKMHNQFKFGEDSADYYRYGQQSAPALKKNQHA